MNPFLDGQRRPLDLAAIAAWNAANQRAREEYWFVAKNASRRAERSSERAL